ncbi:MAG: type II toxin-antitoxin system RelE/ParE family toxin, partial [Candidatus Contendobacter sp.]|nr:type II toxin-antitoxin system RelE/ParE family toxin [Candidatus Contendobacter sp.]
IARRVALAESLRNNPYPHGVTKMVATQNTWRLWEGEYRMIYKVVSNILTVEIIRVDHRREVYR